MRLVQGGYANQHTGQWWFKKFCKADENPEDEKCSGRPLEVVSDQLRAIIEADPLTQEVAKKFSVSHSMVVMQIGKVRKFGKWVSHELTAIKKIVILKCRLLLFYAITTKHFSMRLWHTMKNGFYMTTGNNQLSGWTERKLQSPFQSQTCTKKIYGHCLVACCWSDPPQLSESQWNH